MTVTVLYPEDRQVPDLALEQEVFGPEVRIVRAAKPRFAELDPNDCAATDGLMIMRWAVTAADLDRFPRLRCIVRMGVGYDKLDRKALAERDSCPEADERTVMSRLANALNWSSLAEACRIATVAAVESVDVRDSNARRCAGSASRPLSLRASETRTSESGT